MKKKLVGYLGHAPVLENKARRKKYIKQFKKEGFDDTYTWSLDKSVARFLLMLLPRFRDLYLVKIKEDAELNKVNIDRAVESFKLYLDKEQYEMTPHEREESLWGIKYVAENFQSLWW